MMINKAALSINLVLENDQRQQTNIFNIIEMYIEYRDPIRRIADILHDYVEEESEINDGDKEGLGPLQITLIRIGLGEVDWRELADYWIARWRQQQQR